MNNEDLSKYTPMMRQYLTVKRENPDALLFFRLGDFYEMFFEDAITASRELDIALTKRGAGLEEKAPMCGVPYHVADQYIAKLIKRGYKVAICDQVEDPKLAKGIVKREVTKVLSPGTFTDETYLDEQKNNYLASIYYKSNYVNISYTDYSTGELKTTEKIILNEDEGLEFLISELNKISPAEILMSNTLTNKKIFKRYIAFHPNILINSFEDDLYLKLNTEVIFSSENISSDLKVCIGDLVDNNSLMDLKSTILLLNYLEKTQKNQLIHINKLEKYTVEDNLYLDENTKKNLELLQGINSGKKRGSLLGVLDNCQTAMGSRILKKWLEEPLMDVDKIEFRLKSIEELLDDLLFLDDILSELKEIYDIERLSVKITNDTINPKDIISLRDSLRSIVNIKSIIGNSYYKILSEYQKSINPLRGLEATISNILVDDPPVNVADERIIREGFDEELDKLFTLKDKGQNWILKLEQEEREKTGIKNLRVRYNKILGYFIEVTKSNLNLVPESYIRKQTLVGSERYFTLELKEMESEILNAKDNALELQSKIFRDLKNKIKSNIINIQDTANKIAALDGLASLAIVAKSNNYCRPKLNTEGKILIKEGRHPIVEYSLGEEVFVPNDTQLDLDKNLAHLITGPNMAGKSTYMRQVALICIMAHMGSYVPAKTANISIIDRIFTRIGASDNLAQGDSTFMVEMKEVADITSFATSKSLLILDEVGRGTSTYDGLSIAWALLEYILTHVKAKTLFATHYHELTDMEKEFHNLNNLTIEIEDSGNDIVFLRKIVKGYTQNSYGIEVAKLAGINETIINRSSEILKSIENRELNKGSISDNKKERLVIIEQDIEQVRNNNFIGDISDIDINSLTPLEALNLLNKIVKEARDYNGKN